MQRLLELSAQMLRSGEARSKHDNQGGAWVNAIGLNPFISDDAYRFLLATTKAPTRLGADEITDTLIGYARRPNPNQSQYAYFLGDTGRIYKVSTDGTVTVLRPQTILETLDAPTGGMIGFRDSDSTEYLLIATFDTLIRWDFDESDDATHWNESTGLQGAFNHPFHRLFDSIYMGNGPYIARIPLDQVHNQSGSLSNIELTAVKVGQVGDSVTAFDDDGHYLIAGISHSFNDTTESSAPHVREATIVWYSGVGTNWEWETTLKGERAVRAIVRNALGVFAIGEQTIYKIQFGGQPELVRTFGSEDRITMNNLATPTFTASRGNLAASFGDSMIFGKRGAVYGKRYPTEQVTFSHPLQGQSGDLSLLAPDFEKSCIYAGTEDGKLWKFDMTEAGDSENDYTTRWFDLNGDFTLMGLEIELPEGIGEDDEMTLTVEVPSGQTAEVILSQAAVNPLDRYYAKPALSPHLSGSKVRFTLSQSGGAPRLGGFYLYGEPNKQ